MKPMMYLAISIVSISLAIISVRPAYADTPPPGTVKAKTYTGDGVTPITSTGASGALDVNVRNASLPVSITNPANGSPGSTAPAQATQIGGVDGSGNLRVFKASLGGVLSVDGSGVTQPVSGTFWQSTQPVSLLSLPSLTAGSATIGAVNINGTVPVSGTFWQSTQPVSGTFWQATQPVSAATLPLPTGAATAANQTTGNTSLSTIATNTGNIVPSNNVSCTLTNIADTGCSLTTSGATTIVVSPSGSWSGLVAVQCSADGSFFELLPIFDYGTRTAQLFISTNDIASATIGGCQKVRLIASSALGGTGSFTVNTNAGQGTLNVSSSGPAQFYTTTNLRDGSSNAISSTGGSLNVAVSNASLPLPTGAATSALQSSTITTLGSPMQNSGGTVTVTQATASNLNANVSGTVTANAGTGTMAIAAASLPLPSGAATSGNQTTANTSLSTIATNTSNAQGSPTGGTAATKSDLAGGIYNSSAPTLTTGQQASLQLNTNGSLKVDGSAVTQPVSGTVTATGSGNFTVIQPSGSSLHVNVDSAPTTAVSQSGSWTVTSSQATPAVKTVKAAAITVGTSAVRLTNDGLAPPSTRVLLVAQLLSSSTANCFFGPSGVASSGSTRGVQMFAGQSFSFSFDAGDYYAICDASSQTFLITEQE
jgi:hypothetical protein